MPLVSQQHLRGAIPESDDLQKRHLPGGERVCAGYLLGQLADGCGERAPESKIRQFRDRSIGVRRVYQDVVRLEVSMHQAHRVTVVQSQEDVVHEPL